MECAVDSNQIITSCYEHKPAGLAIRNSLSHQNEVHLRCLVKIMLLNTHFTADIKDKNKKKVVYRTGRTLASHISKFSSKLLHYYSILKYLLCSPPAVLPLTKTSKNDQEV